MGVDAEAMIRHAQAVVQLVEAEKQTFIEDADRSDGGDAVARELTTSNVRGEYWADEFAVGNGQKPATLGVEATPTEADATHGWVRHPQRLDQALDFLEAPPCAAGRHRPA